MLSFNYYCSYNTIYVQVNGIAVFIAGIKIASSLAWDNPSPLGRRILQTLISYSELAYCAKSLTN